MFNSQMLDTAISLVFIYFFLSLLCSVIIEIVAGLTKKRARMLKVGISTLLQDETVVKKLYEHPLFVGKTPPGSAFSSFCQSFRTIPSGETKDGKEIVPSYISSRTFVLSLLESLKQHPDLVKKLLIDKNSTLDKKGKIKYFREKLKVLHDENKIKVELLTLLDVAEADSAKAPSAIQACYDKIVELPDILKEILKEIEGRSAVDTVENIKALVNILSDDRVLKKALLPLLERAGGSADKAIENMEKWYDEAMDRVTGWYKRYSQAFALILAFAVALVLNVDTFQIGKAIYRDQALRTSLVNMAGEEIAQHTSTAKESTQGEKSPSSIATKQSTESGQAVSEKTSPSSDLYFAELKDRINKVNRISKEIGSVNLPIGWQDWPDMNADLAVKLLGILLTALMVSLGSNFWFELLNKLLNVRNAGKKPLTREKQDAQRPQFAAEASGRTGVLPATTAPSKVCASTSHFSVRAATSLGQPGVALAKAVGAACEKDFDGLIACFPMVPPPSRVDVLLTAVADGTECGAQHTPCSGTDITVAITNETMGLDLVRQMIIAELVEVLAADIADVWHCLRASGEGLSRTIACSLISVALPGELLTAQEWLNNGRPDYITKENGIPTDTNQVAVGCAVLFLNWLNTALGYSWQIITKCEGSCLAEVYNSLTGEYSAFDKFISEINRIFPSGTDVALKDENPFISNRAIA